MKQNLPSFTKNNGKELLKQMKISETKNAEMIGLELIVAKKKLYACIFILLIPRHK